jgi:hypothetical protein
MGHAIPRELFRQVVERVRHVARLETEPQRPAE